MFDDSGMDTVRSTMSTQWDFDTIRSSAMGSMRSVALDVREALGSIQDDDDFDDGDYEYDYLDPNNEFDTEGAVKGTDPPLEYHSEPSHSTVRLNVRLACTTRCGTQLDISTPFPLLLVTATTSR